MIPNISINKKIKKQVISYEKRLKSRLVTRPFATQMQQMLEDEAAVNDGEKPPRTPEAAATSDSDSSEDMFAPTPGN